ncbi:MAG TPA: hypothetical protein VEI02_11870, partial [Planctomycetota bacterium]|nr:hypothetical protein [Planctomycetota bacterium]
MTFRGIGRPARGAVVLALASAVLAAQHPGRAKLERVVEAARAARIRVGAAAGRPGEAPWFAHHADEPLIPAS